MPARPTALALLALLVAAGGAGACGGDGDGSSGGASGTGDGASGMASEGDAGEDAAEAPDDVVVIEGTTAGVQSLDNTFRAADIQVQPGTTVTWTNDGRNEHDVLPVEGDAWGVDVGGFQPGGSYEHTFTEPGVYDYYCSIHGTTTAGMVGTVVVAEG
jgi:plastocyanin